MDLVLGGFLAGALSTIATVILVEKAPLFYQRLIFKHYLASDIGFTLIATMVLPVTGFATLISALVYMILLSLYLGFRRKRIYGPSGK